MLAQLPLSRTRNDFPFPFPHGKLPSGVSSGKTFLSFVGGVFFSSVFVPGVRGGVGLFSRSVATITPSTPPPHAHSLPLPSVGLYVFGKDQLLPPLGKGRTRTVSPTYIPYVDLGGTSLVSDYNVRLWGWLGWVHNMFNLPCSSYATSRRIMTLVNYLQNQVPGRWFGNDLF